MRLVSLKDLQEEIRDMLSVCFEGIVFDSDAHIELLLGNGQRFNVYVGEVNE